MVIWLLIGPRLSALALGVGLLALVLGILTHTRVTGALKIRALVDRFFLVIVEFHGKFFVLLEVFWNTHQPPSAEANISVLLAIVITRETVEIELLHLRLGLIVCLVDGVATGHDRHHGTKHHAGLGEDAASLILSMGWEH